MASNIEDIMTIDDFKRWKVDALKQYIKERDLSATGNKETLVARAYVAWELKLPVVQTALEYKAQLLKDYDSLLKLPDGTTVTDPKTLKDWESEKDGMSKWPPTMIQDIGIYLTRLEPFRKESTSFSKRLLSDYKDQKAYSYFSSSWLLDVQYHPIKDDSKYCFLKAHCTPSQRINNVPHEAWVLLEKSTGDIISAFCTCFAGTGQNCNHVAALLFKIDFCWQHGYIQKPVTSQPCAWKQGGKSILIEPQQVEDMQIVKPKAGRPEPKVAFHTRRKTLFMPHKEHEGMSFTDFLDRLGGVHRSAVILGELSVNRYSLYREWDAEREQQGTIPPPTIRDLLSTSDTVSPFTEDEVTMLERSTNGQAENPTWFEQRKGRCTASVFKDICTRSATIHKNPSADPSALVNRILGTGPKLDIPAFKYGRRMEPVAANKYEDIQISHKHTKLKVTECGLFVDATHPYIGASPDRLVNCCCGEGLLEVKCPFTLADKTPSADNASFLSDSSGVTCLKTNHQYYYQVQGQMGLTGRKWTDFFVFSHHGYYMERIVFDENFWCDIKKTISNFWLSFVKPKLMYTLVPSYEVAMEIEVSTHEPNKSTSGVSSNTEVPGPSKMITPTVPCTSTQASSASGNTLTVTNTPSVTMVTKPTKKSTSKPKKTTSGKRSTSKRSKKPVFICGHCNMPCEDPDKISCVTQNSIQCDKCSSWWHWGCVNIKDENDDALGMDWFCVNCTKR